MKKSATQCPECQKHDIVILSNQHKSPTCRIICTILTATLILLLVISVIEVIDAIRIITLVNQTTGEITYKYLFASNSRNMSLGSFVGTLPTVLIIINVLAIITVKIIQHILESYTDTQAFCKECGHSWMLED